MAYVCLFVFVLLASVYRGDKKADIVSHVNGIFLRANTDDHMLTVGKYEDSIGVSIF